MRHTSRFSVNNLYLVENSVSRLSSEEKFQFKSSMKHCTEIIYPPIKTEEMSTYKPWYKRVHFSRLFLENIECFYSEVSLRWLLLLPWADHPYILLKHFNWATYLKVVVGVVVLFSLKSIHSLLSKSSLTDIIQNTDFVWTQSAICRSYIMTP